MKMYLYKNVFTHYRLLVHSKKKNEVFVFSTKCMQLETTMLSKTSQAQKDKCHIFYDCGG